MIFANHDRERERLARIDANRNLLQRTGRPRFQ